jgi:O-antigen ligase
VCCFAVVAGGLAINIGRGGQLAFICGLFALAVFWTRQQSLRAVFKAIAAVALCAAFLWLSSPRLQARIAESQADLTAALTEQQYNGSLGGRVAATIVAGEIIREHPILGTGVGANLAAFKALLDSEFKELKPAIYWYQHFHSQYTQIATELGVVGLLALAWIFWELFRGPYTDAYTSAIGLVLGVVYLVGFIGEPYFHKQIPLVTFALFAGLISADSMKR